MGTKNNPGKFDCYEKAELDEPMFILLARDKYAPTLVWLWAALRSLEDQENKEKVDEARECVASMMMYQHSIGKCPIGIGQAALVGVMELVRAANFNVEKLTEEVKNDADNRMTSVAEMRVFMSALKAPMQDN